MNDQTAQEKAAQVISEGFAVWKREMRRLKREMEEQDVRLRRQEQTIERGARRTNGRIFR